MQKKGVILTQAQHLVLVGMFIIFFLTITWPLLDSILASGDPSVKSFRTFSNDVLGITVSNTADYSQTTAHLHLEGDYDIVGFDSNTKDISNQLNAKYERPKQCLKQSCLCLFEDADLVECVQFNETVNFYSVPFTDKSNIQLMPQLSDLFKPFTLPTNNQLTSQFDALGIPDADWNEFTYPLQNVGHSRNINLKDYPAEWNMWYGYLVLFGDSYFSGIREVFIEQLVIDDQKHILLIPSTDKLIPNLGKVVSSHRLKMYDQIQYTQLKTKIKAAKTEVELNPLCEKFKEAYPSEVMSQCISAAQKQQAP